MRRCFQCGALTDVAGLTRVGDGEFCATCFRALLAAGADAASADARADTKARASVDARAGSPPAARPAPAAAHAREGAAPRARPPAPERATCLVCDCDLTGAPAVVFLGGEICGPCSAEMAAELEAAHAGPSTEPSVGAQRAVAAPAAGAGDPSASPSERASAAPFTPGSGAVTCAGCERPMPGPGSYRVLRGKPYCAACVPFFARLPPAVYEAPAESGPSSGPASNDSVSTSPSSSPLARPGQCDCCRRALDQDADQREGFELCSACLTSDAELALSVARARHRRALARLRSKLEGER